jgi:hypothetical protein
MSNIKRRNRVKHKKEVAGALKPGDLIPMPDHQREFLELHGKYVHNPEMELIMAQYEPTNKRFMNFGNTPLPWETPVTAQDMENLKVAQRRVFTCQNKHCSTYGQEAAGTYSVVTHKKEIPHSDTGNTMIDVVHNRMDLNRFGRREKIDIHVEVRCKKCGEHIQFVKRNLSNRRAAKDPLVSGPHQRTRR